MSFAPRHFSHGGFTLVELLVVVIILGILAAVVVPSFGASSEDARVSTLRGDLAALRRAIERYQVEHGGRYPGQYAEDDGTTRLGSGGPAKKAFIAQLTLYSSASGRVSATRTAKATLGPYVIGGVLPRNPFLRGDAAADANVKLDGTDITLAPTADGDKGWKFYLPIGRLVANDGTTLSDGVTRTVDF